MTSQPPDWSGCTDSTSTGVQRCSSKPKGQLPHYQSGTHSSYILYRAEAFEAEDRLIDSESEKDDCDSERDIA